MRLILRSMLGIIPVFLALSIIIGALIVVLERRETTWALEEEGRSTAIAVASFIEPARLRQFARDELSAQQRADFSDPLNRIMSAKRIDRLVVFESDDRRELLDLGRLATPATRATDIPAGLVDELLDGSQGETRLIRLEDASEALLSAASIRDDNGRVSAILAVQHDAGVIARRFDLGVDDAIAGVSIALGLGLLCSLVVAGVIRARIRAIHSAVDRAAEGNYDPVDELETGMIAEFNALGNTLETMIAALRAAVGNVRRGVVEVDQFRTEQDLATAFEETHLVPVRFGDSRFSVLINSIGPLGQGVFFDLVEQPQRLICVFGSVDRAGIIEPALAASAVVRYFRDQLPKAEPGELADELFRTFPLARLRMLCLDRETGAVWASNCSAKAQQAEAHETTLENEALVYQDLPADLGRRLELFLGAFSSSKSRDLMDNLRRVVSAYSAAETGVLVVIRRQDESSAHG
jgi:HAMP domain-containing protein